MVNKSKLFYPAFNMVIFPEKSLYLQLTSNVVKNLLVNKAVASNLKF